MDKKVTRPYKFYNDGVNTKKFFLDEEIPDGWVLGNLSMAGRTPWNKGLKASDDERVKKNVESTHEANKKSGLYNRVWNKGLTKETDSRIKGLCGEDNPMYGKHPVAWNKGLTKETDERMKKASDNHKGVTAWNKGISIPGHLHTEETKEKIRKTHMNVEFVQRRFDTMRKNGTIGINKNSVAEKELYNKLVNEFGSDDVFHPYLDKARYPFQCDFYIKSIDKFIELHKNWTHGGQPFDPNNSDCIKKLDIWKEKAKTSDYYKNAIYTWTDLDVRKREIAKKNNLNFEEIY